MTALTGQAHSRREHTFGLIDETAKREIRRATLKAVCIPGYQVPFASREMPLARGFGTGGLQLTLSLIGTDDTLKVIDQGSDESVNACNMRDMITRVCPGVEPTFRTQQASIVQTRHRVPETPLREDQILVFQVPYPDALVVVEANEARRVQMHGEADYARLFVKLYEDIVQFDEITLSHRYPTRVHGHYIIDPSPIPRYDVPNLHRSRNLNLFGAGREKKIYAVPPYTDAQPLAFEDVTFRVEEHLDEQGERIACCKCGAKDTFLDELIMNDGSRAYACSDTEYCNQRSGVIEREGGMQ